jgi:hypothetical protein
MRDNKTILSLISASSTDSAFEVGSPELFKFRYTRILSQIEIASCFRNDVKALFRLLHTLIPTSYNPQVCMGSDMTILTHTCCMYGLYVAGSKARKRRNKGSTSL